MGITKKLFGQTAEGIKADIFTLINSNGMVAEITNYGGIIVSLKVPDNKGKLDDVVLGFDNLEDYLKNPAHFGAIIGRHANRIEKGKFEINGIEYNVAVNDGNNHLHGGFIGFEKKVWHAEMVVIGQAESLVLTYRSVDGEENYPGNLDVKVTYTLTEDNSLEIDYFALTDKDTVVNLTNHSYFNLSGHGFGSVLNQEVMINADKFTVADNESIPTGEIKSVKNTPMDLTKLTRIGDGIDSDYQQIVFAGGYDHNWIINEGEKSLKRAAQVFDKSTGRLMEVYTTLPGIQFYSGNFLDGSYNGKDGAIYNKRAGLCLETQYYPNSLKHKNFPSPILKAGEEYKHTTIYKFLTK